MGDFELFVHTRKRWTHGLCITIHARGLMTFSAQFYDLNVKNNKFILLFYNRKRRVIGFKMTKKEEPNAHKIRIIDQRNRKSWTRAEVTIVAFMKYFNILPNKSKRYKPIWDKRNKLFELEEIK